MLTDPKPTSDTIETFETRLCRRFPSKNVGITPICFEVELAELHRHQKQSLYSYYKRVVGLMQRIGAKDRHTPTPGPTPITILEWTMHDTIVRAFIRGMNNKRFPRRPPEG